MVRLHCLFKLKCTAVINRTNLKLSVNNKIGLNMWIFGLLDSTAHKLDRCEMFVLKIRFMRCLCESHRCYPLAGIKMKLLFGLAVATGRMGGHGQDGCRHCHGVLHTWRSPLPDLAGSLLKPLPRPCIQSPSHLLVGGEAVYPIHCDCCLRDRVSADGVIVSHRHRVRLLTIGACIAANRIAHVRV